MDTQVDWTPNTPAYHAEREKLPDPLRGDFESLVKMYRFYATLHHKQPFVSYKILADLIREGWRPSADRVKQGA